MKEAAAWLADRLAGERDRYSRTGPAPLVRRPGAQARAPGPGAARSRAAVARRAPATGVACAIRRPLPTRLAVPRKRFRAVLRRRRRFDFDAEVGELSRVDQAVAFLALLELRKTGEVSLEQAAPFLSNKGFPVTQRKGKRMDRPLRLITANPLDQLARTLEALLVVASALLSVDELTEAATMTPAASGWRWGCSLSAIARVGVGSCSVTSRAGTPSARRAMPQPRASACSSARLTAASRRRRSDACDRRLPRAVQQARDRTYPRRRCRLGMSRACSKRGLIAEAGRDDSPAGRFATERRRCSSESSGWESAAVAAARRPGWLGRGDSRAAPDGRRRQDRLAACVADCASRPAEPARRSPCRSRRSTNR